MIEDRTEELLVLHRRVFGDTAKAAPKNGRRPAEPLSLSDTELLEKARGARYGDQFTRLYDRGETSDHGGDDSAADWALLRALRFWSQGDTARMKELFMRSALYRPEGPGEAKSVGYLERTVANVIAAGGKVYDPSRPGADWQPRDEDAPPETDEAGYDDPREASSGDGAGEGNGAAPSEEDELEVRPPQPATDPGFSLANPDEHLTRRFAEAILKDDHFARDAGGKLYWFSGGVYRPDGERRIGERVKKLALAWEEKWTSYRANEVTKYIGVDCPALWDRPPSDRICVLNGILDLETKSLSHHDPEFLSPVQFPAQYDSAATCPENERFVQEVFPEDARAVAWELFADALTPDRSDDRAILLMGEGRNGRSVWLSVYMKFVGSENVSCVSLQKLSENRFAPARLLGMLANVCPDLPSIPLTDSSIFKAVTTGDPIDAEYNGKDPFKFPPYARLLFSANMPPRSADASPAFFRRWLVIPFSQTFEGEQEIPRVELMGRLTSPAELSGLLNRALTVLPALRRKWFTESESMREAWRDMRSATDPVAVWLDRETVIGFVDRFGSEQWIEKEELRRRYNQDCVANGRPTKTDTAFSRELKKLYPSIETARRVVGDREPWVWRGIGWRVR